MLVLKSAAAGLLYVQGRVCIIIIIIMCIESWDFF